MRLFERTTHALTALCLLTLIVFSAQPAAVAAEATYLIIQVPGALSTFPMSINNSIAVTGYYITSPSTAAGFIRNSDGTLTTFNIAGALWTEPESINDSGDVTGFYEKVAGVAHGFTRDANGRIATFDPSPQGPDGANSQPASTISTRWLATILGPTMPQRGLSCRGRARLLCLRTPKELCIRPAYAR